ncbi:hypothetical protein ECE50_028730 [Chitinophaga sp. Mgbs1]|uniref:PKD domain-containing protein n=1 Tax=Chitinophaga solisilvae TaxID=1233460 RepID=A0A9Q5DB87_9BACT|nr:hypothetical protein [Chitinophaga solisilvae]
MDENILIRECLSAVEKRLNWGSSQEWTTYDFEKLSVEIQESTGVTLSITTLKRLWGRLEYHHMPAVTTLNTMARFAGYADWRDFKKQQGTSEVVVPAEPAVTIAATPRISIRVMLPVILLLAAGGFAFWKSSNTTVSRSADYTFVSNKTMSEGVPNSVIFSYDATAANDTVFIAQSWDVSRKTAVPKDQHRYSTIYYYPGYYRAKLMTGENIVKEHDLMITSGGWVALIEQEKVPVYIRPETFQQDTVISVNEATLAAYNIPMQPVTPQLRFINVKDMPGLMNDHFTLETTIKTTYREGSAACQFADLLILCKNDVIIVPLSAKGCVGELSLLARGASVKSSQADLSGFGCDLTQWVKVRVEASGTHMRFLVNDKAAYTLEAKRPPTGIVGLQYRFNGTGAIKDTRFVADRDTVVMK